MAKTSLIKVENRGRRPKKAAKGASSKTTSKKGAGRAKKKRPTKAVGKAGKRNAQLVKLTKRDDCQESMSSINMGVMILLSAIAAAFTVWIWGDDVRASLAGLWEIALAQLSGMG